MKTSLISFLIRKGLPLLMLATSLIDYTYAKVTRPMDIRFDPAMGGGTPSMTAYPTGRADDAVKTIRFTCVAWDTVEHVLSVRDAKATETVSFILPTRGHQDYIGVRVEEVLDTQTTKKIGFWAALYRNGQSNLTYNGNPLTKRPKDFDQFWAQARKDLDAIPLKPIITEEKTSSPTGRLYKVLLASYGNVTVVSWVMTPKEVDLFHPEKTTKKYPAIQAQPGYACPQGPYDRTDEGYITLSMNPRGHGASNEYWPLPGDHQYYRVEDPKEYYYHGAYLDCIRGLDFLFSRPEVDTTRVGVEGSSQGGAFTIALCGLDHRIRCGVAYVPFIVNLRDFGPMVSRKFQTLMEDPKIGKKVQQTLMYHDPANIAESIQCPIMVTVGLQDQVCPPLNGVVALNRVPAGVPRALVTDPMADHEIAPLFGHEKVIWQNTWLKK